MLVYFKLLAQACASRKCSSRLFVHKFLLVIRRECSKITGIQSCNYSLPKNVFFSKIISKDLNPSYQMDLDLWDYFGGTALS